MAKKITRKKVDKVARAVTKAVGGRDFAKYVGQSIAKRKNPSIKKTVTKKQAMRSGARIGLAIATLGTGVAGARASKATKSRKVPKAVSHQGSSNQIKRTYSGHEKAALKRAAKRRNK